MNIAANLCEIKSKIEKSLAVSGRKPGSVKLIAVTKTVDENAIRQLHAAGHSAVGENRPQSLRDKIKILGTTPLEWHFIGNLQTNKIKYVYPVVSMIHSVDRTELLDHFILWAQKTGRKCPCLLEVHISDEINKNGFSKSEIMSVIEHYNNRPELDIRGLMGMAPFTDEASIVRAAFKSLSEIFAESRNLEGISYEAKDLSMGMTDDFQIAIEEGATIVRIGRAIFS